MKHLRKSSCIVIALCLTLSFILPAQACTIIYSKEELQDSCAEYNISPNYPVMHVYRDTITYNGTYFINLLYDMCCDFRPLPYVDQNKDNTYSISVNQSWDIAVSDVTLTDSENGNTSPRLEFDYSITADSADIEKNTAVVLFYKETTGTINTSEDMLGTIIGQQFIRCYRAGSAFNKEERVSIDLPKNFDPSKYSIGIALWQVDDSEFEYKYKNGYAYLASPMAKSSPIKIINLSSHVDSFTVWNPERNKSDNFPQFDLHYTLSNEESAHFTDLIKDAAANGVCTHFPADMISLTDNILAISLPHIYGISESGANIMCADKSPFSEIYVAITDKKTSEVLRIAIFEYRDTYQVFELPDDFDPIENGLVFFEYNDLGHIVRYRFADPVNYTYGDVDKNGSVDLLDVTSMLKYIAGWENVEIDRSLLNSSIKNNYFNKNGYDLLDVSSVLKLIAGWSVADVFDAHKHTGYFSLRKLCCLSGLSYIRQNNG